MKKQHFFSMNETGNQEQCTAKGSAFLCGEQSSETAGHKSQRVLHSPLPINDKMEEDVEDFHPNIVCYSLHCPKGTVERTRRHRPE